MNIIGRDDCGQADGIRDPRYDNLSYNSYLFCAPAYTIGHVPLKQINESTNSPHTGGAVSIAAVPSFPPHTGST